MSKKITISLLFMKTLQGNFSTITDGYEIDQQEVGSESENHKILNGNLIFCEFGLYAKFQTLKTIFCQKVNMREEGKKKKH